MAMFNSFLYVYQRVCFVGKIYRKAMFFVPHQITWRWIWRFAFVSIGAGVPGAVLNGGWGTGALGEELNKW